MSLIAGLLQSLLRGPEVRAGGLEVEVRLLELGGEARGLGLLRVQLLRDGEGLVQVLPQALQDLRVGMFVAI